MEADTHHCKENQAYQTDQPNGPGEVQNIPEGNQHHQDIDRNISGQEGHRPSDSHGVIHPCHQIPRTVTVQDWYRQANDLLDKGFY
ncbi:hypothetical protein GCM10011339_01960 [Echinicola rosea]|uniref:Uncharacterized protein n=1 Tax=Echinicola rosea TaxID=1807691 RepID=A0ABQ1UFK7_9BACT|nr:hypothetical protein GCM10011339_01960 [Echinicola rosea]